MTIVENPMQTDPIFVAELRSMFVDGATPSALIRCIAVRHAGVDSLDWLVRAYFREAFQVPMLRVGAEQVRWIAEGGSLPVLNVNVFPQMVETVPDWDFESQVDGGWLESVPPNVATATDPATFPEFAGCWAKMDVEAQQYLRRLVANARVQYRNLEILAALAERLQSKAEACLVESV